MIVVVEPHNMDQHADLVDQMFRQRAKVFRDRLGWDVTVTDGRERDRYDELGPVYIIHTDASGRAVLGSLRLLPTTGPTLLADIFADTLPDAARLVAPSIWECTRFCLDEAAPELRDKNQAIAASGILIAALGEVGLKAGIGTVLGNFDASMIRVYRRIGCEVEVLGSTHRFGRPVYLGSFPVSAAILKRVKARLAGASDAAAPADPVAADPKLAA